MWWEGNWVSLNADLRFHHLLSKSHHTQAKGICFKGRNTPWSTQEEYLWERGPGQALGMNMGIDFVCQAVIFGWVFKVPTKHGRTSMSKNYGIVQYLWSIGQKRQDRHWDVSPVKNTGSLSEWDTPFLGIWLFLLFRVGPWVFQSFPSFRFAI